MSFTLLETPLVGLEDIQRAAFYVFVEGMENSLEEIAAYWLPRDQQFDLHMGTDYAPIILEDIPNSNFHEGHKPSLLNGAPENYPNLAVFATRADPDPTSDSYDQLDVWTVSLLIEIMVKAPAPDPNDMSGTNEVICNRRIQRTAEAAMMCLRRNIDLGGAVYGLAATPSTIITDVFAVRSVSQGGAYPGEQGATGQPSGMRYLWQGASINARIRKVSATPSSGPSTFASSSQVDYSANIDQG